MSSSYHIEEKIREASAPASLCGLPSRNTLFKIRVTSLRSSLLLSGTTFRSVELSTLTRHLLASTAQRQLFRVMAEPGQRVRLQVGMHRSDRIKPN